MLWPFHEHCPVGVSREEAPHPELSAGEWPGEFIGTWVNTASLAAWNAGDGELRAKIDTIVEDWLSTQQEDGYLGTYDEEDRWESWDVWVQAHDLIGLLGYRAYTGSEEALAAAIKIADRLLLDFGPGQSYLHSGPHGGMASAALLEPLIWLYRETGNERYLEFGKWMVDEDWEAPGGIAICSSLQTGHSIADTADAKAAEMLLDFTGLLELHRATGTQRYLEPVLIAWDEIVSRHLYITGSASTGEFFRHDSLLRNDGFYHIGETCVTMAWLYLNLSLGRLTGESRFFDRAEQSFYNHLLGAQSPDGRGWVYYMGLRDSKRYRWHTNPECCPKRGSRALAQMPEHVFGLMDDGISVNFYEPSEAVLPLDSQKIVKLSLSTNYPFDGEIQIEIALDEPSRFTISLRKPGWCESWRLAINGEDQKREPDSNGYLNIHRKWSLDDRILLDLAMPVRVLTDELGNRGRVAFMRGPLVYAADSSYLPKDWLLDDVTVLLDAEEPAGGVRIKDADNASDDCGCNPKHLMVPTAAPRAGTGGRAWGDKERYGELQSCSNTVKSGELELVPFFEAGNQDPDCYKHEVKRNHEPVSKVTYQVWLPYVCG